MFDINWKGWQLTKGKVKNAKGGLRPEKPSKAAPQRAAAARNKVAKKTARPKSK